MCALSWEPAPNWIIDFYTDHERLDGPTDRLIQPSPRGNNISYLPFDPSAPATMFIAGLEYQASPHIFITPNTVLTRYDRDDEGVRPRTDFHLRLTLFINFE